MDCRSHMHIEETAKKIELAKIWNKASSLEQFLLEANVKVPDANKLDLVAARSLHLKKSYWKLWNACYFAAMICSVVWLFLFLASLVGGEQFLSVFGSKLMCYVCMAVSPMLLAMFFFVDTLASEWLSFVDNYTNKDFIDAMDKISAASHNFF